MTSTYEEQERAFCDECSKLTDQVIDLLNEHRVSVRVAVLAAVVASLVADAPNTDRAANEFANIILRALEHRASEDRERSPTWEH